MKYTNYHYGGLPVWKHLGIYYKVLSKHLTKRAAIEKGERPDKIMKVGKWYLRLNKLPKDVIERIR
jgi:hypothetical protein